MTREQQLECALRRTIDALERGECLNEEELNHEIVKARRALETPDEKAKREAAVVASLKARATETFHAHGLASADRRSLFIDKLQADFSEETPRLLSLTIRYRFNKVQAEFIVTWPTVLDAIAWVKLMDSRLMFVEKNACRRED